MESNNISNLSKFKIEKEQEEIEAVAVEIDTKLSEFLSAEAVDMAAMVSISFARAALSECFIDYLGGGDEELRLKIDERCQRHLKTYQQSMGKVMTPKGKFDDGIMPLLFSEYYTIIVIYVINQKF